jgi:3-hydroxyisobutyrate dehydrogenase-like beta-hydroxyacid dehydrogenase
VNAGRSWPIVIAAQGSPAGNGGVLEIDEEEIKMAETRVGFCGMGTMGAAMAANVARAGYPLTVWNRSPGRAQSPIAEGAIEAPNPSTLAADSDVVVICVSDTPDVEEVLFGSNGVAAGAKPGTLVIDCSTIAPAETR